jgi:NAD(P)H dehydrogenase (quinone)
MPTALIIGASGTIGSRLVQELDANRDGISVRLSSSRSETVEGWRSAGRDAVLLDLDQPATFAEALEGVDRVFLLTGYTAAMLYQSKTLVDAAKDAGVAHLVHLGAFMSGRDLVPHYTWHELIETYIEASGLSWTHIQPNVIIESTLIRQPSIAETGNFSVSWQNAARGWVSAGDIAAVAAAVLREGPDVHGGKNYRLSTEVLTGTQVAEILTEAVGTKITCTAEGPEGLEAYVQALTVAGDRLYMESALQAMQQIINGNMDSTTIVHDDVLTVLGRPGTTMAQWARENLQARP